MALIWKLTKTELSAFAPRRSSGPRVVVLFRKLLGLAKHRCLLVGIEWGVVVSILEITRLRNFPSLPVAGADLSDLTLQA